MALDHAAVADGNREGKILCVSAEAVSPVRELLSARANTPVDMAASGVECCQALRNGPYGVIVADFPLPDCSPEELLEEVQRMDSNLPVLIRDAAGGLRDAVRLVKAGARHYFGADLDPAEF